MKQILQDLNISYMKTNLYKSAFEKVNVFVWNLKKKNLSIFTKKFINLLFEEIHLCHTPYSLVQNKKKIFYSSI